MIKHFVLLTSVDMDAEGDSQKLHIFLSSPKKQKWNSLKVSGWVLE